MWASNTRMRLESARSTGTPAIARHLRHAGLGVRRWFSPISKMLPARCDNGPGPECCEPTHWGSAFVTNAGAHRWNSPSVNLTRSVQRGS